MPTISDISESESSHHNGSRPDTAVPSYSWYEYWYRGTTVLACDARVVPVDLAYVIFIDFLALGVLGFCFLLLSNVQFLVLVNLPPGRSHAGGISSRHSRRRYPQGERVNIHGLSKSRYAYNTEHACELECTHGDLDTVLTMLGCKRFKSKKKKEKITLLLKAA